MKIEDLIVLVSDQEIISEEMSSEVLNYGICEFLKAGCSYTQALKIIERAQSNTQRSTYQNQFSSDKLEEPKNKS
jgi:hypothetical protein